MATSSNEPSEFSAEELKQFEDLILWAAYKDEPGDSYEQINNLGSFYNIPLDRKLLVNLCELLGKRKLIKYKNEQDSLQIRLTSQGREYVAKNIKPKTINQTAIPINSVHELIKKTEHSDDFEITEHENKEAYSIDYTPEGKFSNHYFRLTRIRFLFYRVDSDPAVSFANRDTFEAIFEGLRKWLELVVTRGREQSDNAMPKATQNYSTPNVWLVGSSWEGKEQTMRFLQEGIWEAGYDREYKETISRVGQGDTFLLKSTFSKDGLSYLRIKAQGIVKKKVDAQSFSVDWSMKDINLDIENLGFYHKMIEQVKADDIHLISERVQRHMAKNMRVKLQLDNVSSEDLLNRKPFVNALSDYIDRLWNEQDNQAYTIHLTGEWGSGKSNVLKFLSEELETRGWFVLQYNAWENQHIENPWWLFWNKIYKQICEKLSSTRRLRFGFLEFWWRLIIINKLNWISFLFITAIGATILWFQVDRSPSNTTREPFDLFAIVGSVVSIGGSLWLLFKGISTSLLPASDDAAESFQKNINDPIELLKKHFSQMVRFPDTPVAIFVDDIDRCSSKNVVRLLEGIQTIFKSAKVLYVFAGDNAWVRKCFEIEYKDFLTDFSKPGHTLGNFFVEKVFQMSVPVPVVSNETMKRFFKSTLHNTVPQTDKQNKELLRSVTLEVTAARTEKDLETLLRKHRGTSLEQEVIQKVVEHLSTQESQASLEHELEAYCDLLPSNIRSVKRFVNNYALSRQTLLLQGVSFSEVPMDVLIRWLIISSHYPIVAENLLREPWILTSGKSVFHEIIKSKPFTDIAAGKITEDKIRLMTGGRIS